MANQYSSWRNEFAKGSLPLLLSTVVHTSAILLLAMCITTKQVATHSTIHASFEGTQDASFEVCDSSILNEVRVRSNLSTRIDKSEIEHGQFIRSTHRAATPPRISSQPDRDRIDGTKLSNRGLLPIPKEELARELECFDAPVEFHFVGPSPHAIDLDGGMKRRYGQIPRYQDNTPRTGRSWYHSGCNSIATHWHGLAIDARCLDIHGSKEC